MDTTTSNPSNSMLINPKDFDLRRTGYKVPATYKGQALGHKEEALIRQMDRLLLRIVCQNYDAAIACGDGTNEPEVLLNVVWSWMAPVFFTNGFEGDYQIKLPQGEAKFSITQWDSALVAQYKEMCKRW